MGDSCFCTCGHERSEHLSAYERGGGRRFCMVRNCLCIIFWEVTA